MSQPTTDRKVRTAVVGNRRYTTGDKVVFGRNWAQTGVVEGFSDGVDASVLIRTKDGQLVWRSYLKHADQDEEIADSNITISGEMAYELAMNYRRAVNDLREAGAESRRMADKIDRELGKGHVSEMGLIPITDMRQLVQQVNQYAALMKGFGFSEKLIEDMTLPGASILMLLKFHLGEDQK